MGRQRVRDAASPEEALRCLIDWHVTFALDHKALIVVQDRDWSALPLEAREKVRETQRAYVDVWADQLRALDPDLSARRRPGPACTPASGCSTPPRTAPSSTATRCARLLAGMAARALLRA